MTLRKGGHEWTAVMDGSAAVKAVQTECPDAVILDVIMPGMDGIEALATLKGDPRTAAIPIVMLTSRGHSLTRTNAESSGAAAFLTKPFSPTELLATLDGLILKS